MPNRNRGVLVIDHDATIRGAIARKLIGEGVDADVAPTVSDAIRLLDQSKYEVVILDWQLPDGDGGRVLSHLRSSAVTRPERIMVLTGESSVPRGVDRSLVKGVLFKPVDLTGVTAHIRALLS